MTNEIIVVFVSYWPFQFRSLFWGVGKKSTTRFRRRASHSEIAANDESHCKGSLESVIFGIRKPGEEKPWKSKSKSAKTEKEDRTGQPVVGSDPRTVSGHYHEQFDENSFSARHSKLDDDKAWSSQEWKAGKSMDDGTGQTVVTPW